MSFVIPSAPSAPLPWRDDGARARAKYIESVERGVSRLRAQRVGVKSCTASMHAREKLQRWMMARHRRQSAGGGLHRHRRASATISTTADGGCSIAHERSDLAVLSFPQWHGADHANRKRYQVGADAVRRAIRTLLPPERALHLEVAVSSVMAPEQEATHPRAWSHISRQQRDAFDLLTSAAPARAITLGGDCGVEPASIGYFNARCGGNMALLWLDSHGDLNSKDSSPSGNYHGMALRDLIEPGRPHASCL